jgi:hypothetical protein
MDPEEEEEEEDEDEDDDTDRVSLKKPTQDRPHSDKILQVFFYPFNDII